MTFPLTVGPGETRFLANPDQSKYYFWKGEPTSAHYYVNPQGIPEEEACTWAKQGEALGNWAPAIIGTSWDDKNMNTGFTSLKQNELNMGTSLDYSITFEGGGVNCPCRYVNSSKQYCEGNDCWEDRNRGCTVSPTCRTSRMQALTFVRRHLLRLARPSPSSCLTSLRCNSLSSIRSLRYSSVAFFFLHFHCRKLGCC